MTLFKTVADLNGGHQVLMTAEEESAYLAEQAANVAAQPRKDILAQIAALEATATPRRIRDRILDPADPFLANLEGQIAALRAQL